MARTLESYLQGLPRREREKIEQQLAEAPNKKKARAQLFRSIAGGGSRGNVHGKHPERKMKPRLDE